MFVHFAGVNLMENEFKRRKIDNERKLRNTLLCLIINMFFQMWIAYVGIDNIMLMFEMMLVFIKISDYQRKLLLEFGRTTITFLPMVVLVMCNIKAKKLNKESQKVRDEEMEFLCKKAFEENKHEIDSLLEEGRCLSRAELINCLNKTKTELVKAEKNNKFKCPSLDILMLNYLQDGLEDILFPSVVEEEKKEYIKVRKK